MNIKFYRSSSSNATGKQAISTSEKFQCPHCGIVKYDQLSVIVHINAMHEMTRWFKCDICCSMVVNLKPHSISRHYQTEHGIKKTVEQVMEECEITDERTIQRLRESRITKEQQQQPDSTGALEVSEMTHWYTCNECYVSNLYSSKIAIVKHYKDEHDMVITTKQATDECLLNDEQQIQQMIEEGRVEGGFGAGSTANLRLTIKPKTYVKRHLTTSITNPMRHRPYEPVSTASLKDEPMMLPEQKARWGMNYQQNYTSLISRAAQRKFSRNSTSPPPPSISRSASSSTVFSPEFFKDEESPDAPITTNASSSSTL